MFSVSHTAHLLYDAIDKLSVGATAKIGVAGATVAAASSFTIVEPWLQLVPLIIGSLTGIGALVLIVLKNIQQVREMRRARPGSE